MKEKAKKIILIIATVLIIFNISMPTASYATISWQGVLFDPITFLIAGIGDAANNIMQKLMLPGSPKAIMNRDGALTAKIIYSPAAIFSNKVPSLDVNFITPHIKNDQLTAENIGKLEDEGYTLGQKEKIEQAAAGGLEAQGNSAAILSKTISKWYVAIRNIALTGLLIVLVYIGIRIVISSTAEEQAKYKIMIKNWVMAIVLIAFMHFLMMTILSIIETIAEVLGTSSMYNATEGDQLFNTIREKAGDWTYQDPLTRMGYTLIYVVLTMYTIMFTVRYLKRVIYMAFLTVIAPMVALTYPIDKIKDGQSQAFNMWLKEYLFNLLIQPVHLLIYIVLVASAVDLAKTNMIYALVSVGFILQAEKFIKDMFGIQGEGGAMDGNFISGLAFGGIISKLGSGASRVAGLTKGLKGDKKDKIRMHHSERTANKKASQNLEGFNPKRKQDRLRKMEQQKQALQKRGRISRAKTMAKNRIKNSAIGKGVKGAIDKTKKVINGIKTNSTVKKWTGKYKKARDSKIGRTAGNLRRKYLNTNTLKKAGKLAMMGYGAGIGAAIGVASGLASDDFQNVFNLGAAGASGGALLGKEASNIAGNVSEGTKNAREVYLQGKLGDEYEDHLNKRLDKKWENDVSVREHFQTTYGDNWREKMEEAKEYRRQGITDQKEIDQGIKIRDKYNSDPKNLNNQITNEQMANIMGLSDVTRDELMNNEQEIRDKQISGLVGGDKAKEDQVIELLKKRFKM